MKILFIGGNGNISWWCVNEALKSGHEVWELNRGITKKTRRKIQDEVKCLNGDVRTKEVEDIISSCYFDVVCDFICYNEQHARAMVELFKGRCKQYIVISSECVYKDRNSKQPLDENSEKYCVDEVGGYIGGKIRMEQFFLQEYKKNGFPVTIVRPSLTYDTILFTPIGKNDYSVIELIKQGYPLILPGDGEKRNIPLHSRDFATAFVSLIGNKITIGEDYLITADEKITLNDMAYSIFNKLQIAPQIKYLSCEILRETQLVKDKELFAQQIESYNYSNEKIKTIAVGWKQTISFFDGIGQTIDWLNEDKNHIRIDEKYMDNYIEVVKSY